MPVQIDTPIIDPPIPQIIYNEVWIKNFNVTVSGFNSGDPIPLIANFVLVGQDQNGNAVVSPDFNQTLSLPDINATAATDPVFGQLFEQVLAYLVQLAVQNGLFNVAANPSVSK